MGKSVKVPKVSGSPSPLEACEFLWNASRKAELSADNHVLCQQCFVILKEVLAPEKDSKQP